MNIKQNVSNNGLFQLLKTIQNYRLLNNVLAYMDSQTLLFIIKSGSSEKIYQEPQYKMSQLQIVVQQQKKIIKKLKSYYFMRQYLNKADRTMYFSFYEEPEFKTIQTQLTQRLISDNCSNFCSQYDEFQKVFETILKSQTFCQTQMQQLRRIIVDPSLPLPKLKRQNQGMYCKSSFQLFLVSLQFKNLNQEPSYFQQLKQLIKQNQQTFLKYFIQIFKQKHSQQQNLKKVQQLRYTPYEISHQNYKNYILSQNFFIHNFIVYLFALTQLLIQSMSQYIKNLDDPLMRFIEFITRYSIFKNFVIQIEENLSFLFQAYDSYYSDINRQSINNKPKFNFWRPAMTKWYLKMNQFHKQANLVYCFLLFKIRFQNLKKFIEQSSIFKQSLMQDDQYFSSIQNHINSISYQFELSQQIYHGEGKIIEQYCQNNPQSKFILLHQYIQYMVDISINQQTVHWCGHSEHELEHPYKNFELFVINNSLEYFNKIKQIIVGKSKKQSIKFLNVILQEEMSFLQSNGLKPLTLRKLVTLINQQYIFNMQMQNEVIPVSLDFTFKDQNLKYFNEKARIDSSLNQDQKCFFSISPLLSPEQILIKSIDTNDSDKQSKDNDSYQYMSDNEDSLQFNETKIQQNLNLNNQQHLLQKKDQLNL